MNSATVSCWDDKGFYTGNKESLVANDGKPLLAECTTTLISIIPEGKVGQINATKDNWTFIDEVEVINATNDVQLNTIKEEIQNILFAIDGIGIRYKRQEFLISEGENITSKITAIDYKNYQLFKELLVEFDNTVDLENIIWPTPPSFMNKYLNKFEPYKNLV